jgi:hypothetical protein
MSAPGPSHPFLLVSVNGKKEFPPSADLSVHAALSSFFASTYKAPASPLLTEL